MSFARKPAPAPAEPWERGQDTPPTERWTCRCPRCGGALTVSPHWCHRMRCLGPPHPAFEAMSCATAGCEYPMPRGALRWPSGVPFWAHGEWASDEARRIFDSEINPVEPLPAPFDRML